MNSKKEKMDKEELKYIHAGKEKKDGAEDKPGNSPGGNCDPTLASCCCRTDCNTSGSSE